MAQRIYIAPQLGIVGSVLHVTLGPGGSAYETGGPTYGQLP